MGLYDREYVRDDSGYEYGGSRAPAMTFILVGINIAVYVLDRVFAQPGAQGLTSHPLMESLASGPETLIRPWMWWQFITAGFAHDPYGIRHIFSNMFVLFMFGQDVERKLGRHEFLRVYMLAVVLGNVVFALRQLIFFHPAAWSDGWGASGAVTAIFVLFVCYFPTRKLLFMFVIPMPAWLVGVLLIGLDLVGVIGVQLDAKHRIAHDVHLVGAALAAGYWWFGWNFGYLVPQRAFTAIKSWLTRPKLKLHDPTPGQKNLDAEADRVLAKLHSEGEASLTAKERRTLEDYSRRMRQKLR